MKATTVTVANTKENNAKVYALRKVKETQWGGSVVHRDLQTCLTALNLSTFNSGWYNPTAIQIKGLSGWYMLNQDGSIYWEARIIKEDADKYRIEWLPISSVNEFEANYIKYMEEN